MRDYGQIRCAFWQSREAQGFSDAGKLLAAYLLTGPHSNGIGCFRLPDGYVGADLGWPSQTVSKGFDELSKTGFAYRFDGVVFVPKFMRWNTIENPNVAKARAKEFWSLPKGEAQSAVARAMLEFCTFWDDAFVGELETLSETLSKGLGKQEPNRTEPNLTEKIPPSVDGKPSPSEPTPDPIWHTGLAFLKRKGIPEKPARSLLGKVRQAAGDIETAAILQRAEADDVTDPAAWIMAAAANARANPKGQPSKTMQGIQALETMKNEQRKRRLDPRGISDGAAKAAVSSSGPNAGG